MGDIRVALDMLEPILESVLSIGQVAFLGLDSTLYDCLVCLTKRLGQIPSCLVYPVVCHCIFLPCLSRSCLRGIITTVLVRLREPLSLERVCGVPAVLPAPGGSLTASLSAHLRSSLALPGLYIAGRNYPSSFG